MHYFQFCGYILASLSSRSALIPEAHNHLSIILCIRAGVLNAAAAAATYCYLSRADFRTSTR